jgi:hypothetical protein
LFPGDVVSLLPRQEKSLLALARLDKKEGMKKNSTTLGSRGISLIRFNAILLPYKRVVTR